MIQKGVLISIVIQGWLMSVLNFMGRIVFPYFADEGKTEFYHQLHPTVVEYISYRLFLLGGEGLSCCFLHRPSLEM